MEIIYGICIADAYKCSYYDDYCMENIDGICIYDAYKCSDYDDYSMENITKMFDVGLYINDLSMHDSSRDLVLAGTQQSAELKLALDQVSERTAP